MLTAEADGACRLRQWHQRQQRGCSESGREPDLSAILPIVQLMPAPTHTMSLATHALRSTTPSTTAYIIACHPNATHSPSCYEAIWTPTPDERRLRCRRASFHRRWTLAPTIRPPNTVRGVTHGEVPHTLWPVSQHTFRTHGCARDHYVHRHHDTTIALWDSNVYLTADTRWPTRGCPQCGSRRLTQQGSALDGRGGDSHPMVGSAACYSRHQLDAVSADKRQPPSSYEGASAPRDFHPRICTALAHSAHAAMRVSSHASAAL